MITGGNATVYVSNMDRAVAFYTGALGLSLKARFGDHWAEVQAGQFTIGLHPKSEKQPVPGTAGSIQIGLSIDQPIESAVAELQAAGASHLHEIQRGPGGNFVHFTDPDGNTLYLWEAPKWG